VLLSLGFASLTYTGLSVTLDWLKGQALANLTALPLEVVSMLGLMKVGVSLSIIISALIVRMVLDGLSAGGSISRLVKQ
jgi:hypothetical protein